MKVVATIKDVRAARAALPSPVGFVPTMGYLHEGHLALVRAARTQNQSVVVSIFVNPKQFGPNEDYASYPRDLDRDLRLLEQEAVDLVFAPSVEEMYPPGFSTFVDVGPLGEILEGARRPGHFRGVATVVTRLFCLIQPDRAYFGQKDAQQCVVIKKLVADLGLPIEIVTVPTVREPDGLAMSSRNVYLDPEQRVAARVLSASLRAAAEAYERGERNAEALRRLVSQIIAGEPRAQLDYVSVADAETLEELSTVDRPALISLAAWIGRARLIDNIIVGR
ncbi:MAG TPA: pantoate--beta-alanine ligase [Chloroflexota bacterium]|nr:pantoate--beta-alanine ligase [Chloroflexota bacterium]